MAPRASAPGLRLRKLADRSEGSRITRYDPQTGAKKLVNPDTPGEDHEPWPLAGVQILDDPLPRTCRLSTGLVAQAAHEGWMTIEGGEMVHRPGGPPEDPWRVTHSLRHADELIIHTVDGDVRYTVTRQPDKYVEDGSNKKVTTEIYESGQTIVDKFYDLKLVS